VGVVVTEYGAVNAHGVRAPERFGSREEALDYIRWLDVERLEAMEARAEAEALVVGGGNFEQVAYRRARAASPHRLVARTVTEWRYT
jgi:hypothetical protein